MKTLSESSIEHALASATNLAEALDFAEAFTSRYRETENLPAAERESRMLELQFAQLFLQPEAGDRFAGRVRYGLVGLSPEPVGLGYYCAAPALREAAERYPNEAERIDELLAFWQGRTTAEKVRAAYQGRLHARLSQAARPRPRRPGAGGEGLDL